MSTSVPDPSSLTTQQLLREIENLEKLTTQRIHAIEQAVEVAHNNLVRVPTDVDKSIGHLKELVVGKFEMHEEKFNSVQTQFQERDVRTEQTSKDSKVAVDAALQAAKEAVGEQNKSSALAIAKSETSTTKQIDQIGILITSNNKALDDKINDLKERFAVIDGRKEGITTAMAAGLALVTVIVALFGNALFNTKQSQPQPTVAYVPAPVVAPTTPTKGSP